MLYSGLPPTSSASISFGERRLGQSALSKTFSLGIGFMDGQQPNSQRPPYPSPPMTGSSPPDSFSSQRLHSTPQERLHNTSRNMRHQSHGSADTNAETLSPIAADEMRRSPAVATAISSSIHVGRSPFIAQPIGQAQPRKTKSHVASACINCKKAHLACDGKSNLLLVIICYALFCPYYLPISDNVACGFFPSWPYAIGHTPLTFASIATSRLHMVL